MSSLTVCSPLNCDLYYDLWVGSGKPYELIPYAVSDCTLPFWLWPYYDPPWVESGKPHEVIMTVKWLYTVPLTTYHHHQLHQIHHFGLCLGSLFFNLNTFTFSFSAFFLHEHLLYIHNTSKYCKIKEMITRCNITQKEWCCVGGLRKCLDPQFCWLWKKKKYWNQCYIYPR